MTTAWWIVGASVGGLTLFACGAESAANDDPTTDIDNASADAGGRDGAAAARDASAQSDAAAQSDASAQSDAAGNDADGASPSTTFGTLGEGADPCVGAVAGWTTHGRCNARPNRSMTISVLANPKMQAIDLAPYGTYGRGGVGQTVFGADGSVYFQMYRSVVHLSSAGQLLWKTGGTGKPVLGADGTLYTGSSWTASSNDPEVHAVNVSGTVKWDRRLSGGSWPQMVMADGSIIAAGYRREETDNALQALDPATGQDRWVQVIAPSGDINSRYALSASSNGDIFAHRGAIEAFDHATHASRWKTTLTFEHSTLDEAHGRIVTVRSTDPTRRLHYELGSVNLATGAHTAIVPDVYMDQIGDLALGNGPWVYACVQRPAAGRALRAFNLEDPTLDWDVELSSCRNPPIVGGDGTVYVSGYVNGSGDATQDDAITTAVAPDGTVRWQKTALARTSTPYFVDVTQSIDAAGNLWVRFVDADLLVRFYE